MEGSNANSAKSKLAAFGQEISAVILEQIRSIYAPIVRAADNAKVSVTRDIVYGDHDRHRLNVFTAESADSTSDVLVFVHGGGFVTGDKEEVVGTFYDNVGYWAANHGLTGVVINYRLAPDYPWPAGSEDVGSAIAWASEAMSTFGGDPKRLFLMGHSAGATHVAEYLARSDYWKSSTPRVMGGILLSGLYDLDLRPINARYYGEDASLYANRSSIRGLARSSVPLLIGVSEHDPEFIQRHAMSVMAARLDERKSLPLLCQIRGHNHFSTPLHLNSSDTSLSHELLSFIRSITSQAQGPV